MVLKPEPVFQAVESIWPERGWTRRWCCFRRRAGCSIRAWRNRLSRESELLLICGRYEGVDERVAAHLADDEISIGKLRVKTVGELAASGGDRRRWRGLLPGVLGNDSSAAFESFQDTGHGEGLLDCPHWTRPADFPWMKAPEVL